MVSPRTALLSVTGDLVRLPIDRQALASHPHWSRRRAGPLERLAPRTWRARDGGGLTEGYAQGEADKDKVAESKSIISSIAGLIYEIRHDREQIGRAHV